MTGKTGAARVALTTGCPLIPVAQWGPQELLAPYAKRLRLLPRKTMHVWAGPPGRPVGPAGPAAGRAPCWARPRTALLDAITALLEQIRGEQAPGGTLRHPRRRAAPRPATPRRAATGPAPPAPAPDERTHAMRRAAVFGTGSWGTAFAAILADAGAEVRMWGRRAELVAQINDAARQRRLPARLAAARRRSRPPPTRPRPSSGAEIVVLAVPSQTLRANLAVWAGLLPADAVLVVLMKGVELGTTRG